MDRSLGRESDVIQEDAPRHAPADAAEEGHDQQTDDGIAAVVGWIAGDEHAVQGVDAGGEQVDIGKAWQVHVEFLLTAAGGRARNSSRSLVALTTEPPGP